MVFFSKMLVQQKPCDKKKLAIEVGLLGATVLALYYWLLPEVLPGKDLHALWFGISPQAQTLYSVSIALSACAFLASFVWMWRNTPHDAPTSKLCIAYGVFLLGAIGWPIALWVWGKYGLQNEPCAMRNWIGLSTKTGVVATLTATSVGAALLFKAFQSIAKEQTKQQLPSVVHIALGYLFFHVFFLDNLNWSYYFLKHNCEKV